LNRADKIICANSRTAAEARGLVLPLKINKVTVVNPGIDTKPRVYDEVVIRDLKQRYDLRGKAVLLTVGRLVRRKGVDLVLEALAACTDKSLVYVIIGSGPEEASIKELIHELGLQDQVRLLLDVDDEEKAHWFQVADIFVMTSRDEAGDYEGFGIVYLEAGLAGKPVIAARGGGVADAVIDKETGLLVKPGDINELKAAIIKLKNYEGLRIRLGDNGRRRAQSEFNWEGQAGKIFDIIAKQ
jgi:phosphatidylinositol alpha-1,6-mannosyltransferase